MRNLINSLLPQLEHVIAELPLLYDMAYRKPGRTGDDPKVSAPRIDPASPQGDPAALEAWRLIERHSTTLVVRLAYVQGLHRIAPSAMPVGSLPLAVTERLRVALAALSELGALSALRSDEAMREQMVGNYSAPAVAPAVEQMHAAVLRVLPKPAEGELEALRATDCVNCHERPALKGRKRCGRCHSYFARHATEWQREEEISPLMSETA